MIPIRRGIVILLGVLWSTLPRTASADVCEVDLTVETSDLGETYRLIVGESGDGLALCLAPEPSEEDALALAEEPRVVAHVAATDACVTTTDSRTARRRDPFTLLEVVVAGHNVVLDYQPDGLDCGDPDAIAPPTASDGRVARLSPVGLGDVDVEVLNLEDDSSMGVYTGPPVEPVEALDPAGLGGGIILGPSLSCYLGSFRNAYYGRLDGSTTTFGACGWTPSGGEDLICSFTAPAGGDVFLYGNSQNNTIRSPSSGIACIGQQQHTISPWYSQWTARPVLYGSTGVDYLYGAGMWSVIHGGDQDDWIVGTNGPDQLYGEGGDNYMFAYAGNDLIYGGTGPNGDYIDAGSGADSVWGDNGPDEIHGGSGDDYLVGEAGADDIYGDADSDTIEGGPNNDWIEGGTGNDWIYGGYSLTWHGDPDVTMDSGADQLFGDTASNCTDSGHDMIYTGMNWFPQPSNYAAGGPGDDDIFGAGAGDVILGDCPHVTPARFGTGQPAIWGDNPGSYPAGFCTDELINDGGNWYPYHGSTTGGTDYLVGGGGGDWIHGCGGVDTIFGDGNATGSGSDYLSGGCGNDVLRGGGDADVVAGDMILCGCDGSDDWVYGTTGADSVSGDCDYTYCSSFFGCRTAGGDDHLFGETPNPPDSGVDTCSDWVGSNVFDSSCEVILP